MIDRAIQLAKALDAEDYDEAAGHLAQDCVYEFRDAVLRGSDAIIASYRASGEGGRARFDAVRYESSVSALGSSRARIDYTDVLTLDGEMHSHRCAQEVTLDEAGFVSHIRHIDLEGEREALRRFEEEHSAASP